MGKRVKFGDVIEIPTNKGLAYAIYTHRHVDPPVFGPLLRVFAGFHKKRPKDFKEIVANPIRFSKFFPLVQVINRKIFEVVAHEEIPKHLQTFPSFRNNPNTKAKRNDEGWWIWDGKKEWKVGYLSNDQKLYPKHSIVNDTALREMIEGKWGPDDEL